MFGTRPTASRRCEPRARGVALLAVEADRDALAVLLHAEALGVEPHFQAFRFQDLLHRLRDVFVLAADEPRAHLDDRNAAAEAPVHLAELEADVAAADEQEMLRHEVDVHHRDVGEVGHLIEAGHLGHQRPAADVDEDLPGARALRR